MSGPLRAHRRSSLGGRHGLGARTIRIGTFGSASIPDGTSESYTVRTSTGEVANGKVWGPGGADSHTVSGEIVSADLGPSLSIEDPGATSSGGGAGEDDRVSDPGQVDSESGGSITDADIVSARRQVESHWGTAIGNSPVERYIRNRNPSFRSELDRLAEQAAEWYARTRANGWSTSKIERMLQRPSSEVGPSFRDKLRAELETSGAGVQDAVDQYNRVVRDLQDLLADVGKPIGDQDFPSRMRQRARQLELRMDDYRTVRASSYSTESQVPDPPTDLEQDARSFAEAVRSFLDRERQQATERYNRVVRELKNRWLPRLREIVNTTALPSGIRQTARRLTNRIQDLSFK